MPLVAVYNKIMSNATYRQWLQLREYKQTNKWKIILCINSENTFKIDQQDQYFWSGAFFFFKVISDFNSK